MKIINGKCALSGKKKLLPAELLIQDGKISALGKELPEDKEVLDAEGLYIFPGMIDAHVHFNTPGYEEREDFYHGSCFALSGGVTTVIDMPCTSIPAVTNIKNLQEKLKTVSKQAVTDFAFYGGVSAQNFSTFQQDMDSIVGYVAGCKVYTISSMEEFGSLSYQELREVLQYGKTTGLPVLLHAEDKTTVIKNEQLEKQLGNKAENYYRSRPEGAEYVAVERAARDMYETQSDLHIVHISTGKGVELAKKYGASVETCPHYLAFSLDDFIEQGSILKVAPCLKKAPAREELWDWLAKGEIDFVTSDHAAGSFSEKSTGSIWTDYSGICGTGTMFPFLYSEGFVRGRLTLKRFLEITSSAPAERYHLNSKGSIERGKDADLILLDPNEFTTVRGKDFLSKSKLSPWEGKIFSGRIKYVFRRGELVYQAEKGILAKAGSGRFLKPEI